MYKYSRQMDLAERNVLKYLQSSSLLLRFNSSSFISFSYLSVFLPPFLSPALFSYTNLVRSDFLSHSSNLVRTDGSHRHTHIKHFLSDTQSLHIFPFGDPDQPETRCITIPTVRPRRPPQYGHIHTQLPSH